MKYKFEKVISIGHIRRRWYAQFECSYGSEADPIVISKKDLWKMFCKHPKEIHSFEIESEALSFETWRSYLKEKKSKHKSQIKKW